MSTVNHVLEIGFLTRAPEIKIAPSGLEIVSFSIAVHSRIKSKTEAETYDTVANFFDCVAFGKYFASVAKSMQKGRKVAVHGSLRQNRWEKDGEKHQSVQIVVDEIDVFPPYPKSENPEVNAVAEAFGGSVQEQPEIY